MEEKSHFLLVACPECGNKQRIFESASTKVHCLKCNALIAEPRAGRAEIKGKILKVFS